MTKAPEFTTISGYPLGEDATFSVTHNPSGRKVICCDTGNGGSEAYELVETTRMKHVYRDICFAPTASGAEAAAKRYLKETEA